MAQNLNRSDATPAKNVVKVNVLRANVKQTKVIDTDIVFVLEDGRTVFIRDGAVQSLLDNGFSVEFIDGTLVSGQELLQSAGTAEISSVALTGPQASSNDGVIVVQAPQATVAPEAVKPSSGGGLKSWFAIGTPVVGGVLAGVLSGGGGSSSSTPTSDSGSNTVKPATPVINVIANDDKVNATEKADGVSVTGTSEATASVTVIWGNTTKTVTADSTGRWSASFASGEVPADAPATTISATVKSAAGVSSDPATKTVQIDTTPPGAPVIANVAGDNVIGPTEKASGVNINGTAEAGSTVSVGFGGINKTVAADMGGNWSVNYTASEIPVAGNYAVTASARDANGNIGSSPASRPIVVSAAVNVMGQIVAGPVIVGNGLSVDIYLANGTLLVSGIRVNSDGSFTAANLPIDAGDVIIAKVVDSTTGPDYLDEATGVAKDLNAVLLAVKTVEGTTVTMNINPLTTVAAIKAGLAADGSGTVANAAAATNANKATAQAFGLADIDITTTSVVATNSGGFDATDQLSSGEKIGAVLAALSGLDNLNGGNSQATVVAISQLLNVDGSKGQLSDQGQVRLMDGAIAAEDRVNGTLQNFISNGLASSSSTTQVTINAIATDNIITANEVANLTVSGTVSSSVTGVSVLLGTRTATAKVTGTDWSYTLSADDLAALGADGPVVIKAQAALPNAASVISTRVVTLKTAPPAAPSLNVVSGDNAINGSEKTAGVAFSGTSEVGSTVSLTFGSVTKNVLVGAAGTWTMAFSASEIPADGTSTVSVSARDVFGNSSVTVTRPILIDTIAPNLPTIRPVTGDDVIGPTEKVGGVQIQGTADALATIRLTLGDIVRTATADASGNWSVSFLNSQVPNDGDYALTVTQSDVAGNVSAEATRTVRVDAQPPARPIILPVATDNIINAAEKLNGVTLRGTAEPNVSIELNWGTISRTIRASASGTWSASFTGAQIPTDGSSDVTATATDSSGNISETATRTVTIDSINQNLIILSVATDDIINAAEKASNVVVTGEAEPGSSVVVTLGGTSRETLADQDGFWVTNFTTNEIPADTVTSTVTARSTDRAGNVSVLVEYDIGIDTVRPNAPVFNIVAGDNVINANEATAAVEISGTAEAFSLVTVNWGTATRTANVDADGNWRTVFPASQIPPEGASVVYATATDDAKNISVTAEHHVLIDLGTVRPVINTIAGNDVINAAERTNGVLVTGTAEAGATVRLVWGTVIKNPVADQDGNWSQLFIASEIPLSGNATITATPTDINGNVGATSLPKNFTIDTQALPAVFDNVTGPDNIVNASEKSLGVSVTGTAEVGSTVLITWGATVKSVTADASGVWTTFFTSSQMPADGATSITAVVTDLAGNVSVQSGQPVTIDTVPPLAPIITIPIAGDGVVNNTERAGGVVVAGTAEAHADVTIAWGTTSSKTVRGDAAGVWTATFVGDEINPAGSATISVSQIDVAGNSGPAATATVIVNTSAPPEPIVNAVATNDVVNALEKADGVTFSGTALGQSTVSVNWGITKTATAAANGNWSVTFAADEVPADGPRAFTVFQTDTLGNVSPSTSRVITVDTMLPAVPTINQTGGSDQTINAAEKAASVLISGTTDAGNEVLVTWGGIEKSVTSNNGTWSVSYAGNEVPADTALSTISVRARDAAGNFSSEVTQNVGIDSTIAAPVINIVSDNDRLNATEALNPVTISGKAEANATVRLRWGETAERTLTADANGNWSTSYAVVEMPPEGINAVTARQTDVAGNISAQASRSVEIDTVQPPTPVITGMSNDYGNYGDFATDRNSVVLTGSGVANGLIELYVNGTYRGFATVDSAGLWESPVINLAALSFGSTITATVRATDAAGNVNVADASVVITKQAVSTTPIDVTNMPASAGFTFAGALFNGFAGGLAMGNIGGDSHKDLILSNVNLDTLSESLLANRGGVTVVYGRSSWAGVSVYDLMTAGTNGWVLVGAALNDALGHGGAGVIGDLNGDGFGELIAGAINADNGTIVDAGAAYIVWGSSTPLGTPPVNPSDGDRRIKNVSTITPAEGFVFRGLTTNENLGNATLGISTKFAANTNENLKSDFNGDGVADFFIASRNFDRPAIGAQTAADNVGATIVVFGRTDRVYGNLNPTTGQQEMTINDLTADKGFIIRGLRGDSSSGSIASAGDVNGDGVTDLLIGSRYSDRPGSPFFGAAGAAYVVYGKKEGQTWSSLSDDPGMPGRKVLDLANLQASDGFMIMGEAQDGELGRSVEGLGDVNGDGIDDFIVAAPVSTVNGVAQVGKAFVIFGSRSGQGDLIGLRQVLSITDMRSNQGFIIQGVSDTLGLKGRLGESVGAAGDVNGDGLADIIVNAPYLNKGTAVDVGRSYIIYGKNNGDGWGQIVGTQSILDLNNFGPEDGFSIVGKNAGDNLGATPGIGEGDSSIIAPGDLNNDGIDDLYLNLTYSDPSGRTNAGEGLFVYGTPGRGGMSLSGSTGANVLSGGGLADVITGLGGEDRLRGFGGNDTLIVSDASFIRVDGGTGTDTLRLAGATGFGLNLSTLVPGAIKDIEQIDLVAGSLNNTLTITQQSLLDLSSTSDLLRVFGDDGDIVNVTGFVSGSSVTDKGVTYNIFTSGAATLWVQNGVTVVGATPPPSGFVAPAFAWAEHAVLAA